MRLNKIKENDIVNGEGVCVSIWVQGCPHRCKGCHNPETWEYKSGKECTHKDFEEILKLLDKNGVKRNLSILGGEPLSPENIDGVSKLCRYIKRKRPETKIYLWTGYEYTQKMDERALFLISAYVDILIDGRFVESKKDLKLYLRGSSNQRVIDIKKSFEKSEIILHTKY